MGVACMVFTISISAVPAKPGMWRTLQLKHGKEVRAQLVGDEWFHSGEKGQHLQKGEQEEVGENAQEKPGTQDAPATLTA